MAQRQTRAREPRPLPETARALAAIPLADIDGLCPNAMFSALAPKAHIPPHNGETNARVVLIFDLWNPLLAPAERDLARTLTVAARVFGSA